MADEAQPAADLDAVADTLQSTVLGVWTEFVGHVPYLVAGLFVVVGTWCGVALFHRLSHRLFRRSKLRPSLQVKIPRERLPPLLLLLF
jgi:hypothetical protein